MSSDSPVFSVVTEALERETTLDRVESRGTVRLVLRDGGLDSQSVDVRQMKAVIRNLLPEALRARGIPNEGEVCARLDYAIECEGFDTVERESPEDVFARLGR